jgi:hypothetical protein
MDELEQMRMQLVEVINARVWGREQLEQAFGTVLDTDQVRAKYRVRGFSAPLMVATNTATGEDEIFVFQHLPRFYWPAINDPMAIGLLMRIGTRT